MNQINKERHAWCEQKAREFFANKNRKKWYHTYYKDYDCDLESDWYEVLPDSFVDKLKAAFNDFISENNLSSAKDMEPDEREEIIKVLDPDEYGIGVDDPYYGYPSLVDVDFDDFKYFYKVRGTIKDRRFTSYELIEHDSVAHIVVDDEDYIRVLTELLYAPTELSFDDLYGIIPQTCELIKQACEKCGVIGDIVLQEMNNDVKTILKTAAK